MHTALHLASGLAFLGIAFAAPAAVPAPSPVENAVQTPALEADVQVADHDVDHHRHRKTRHLTYTARTTATATELIRVIEQPCSACKEGYTTVTENIHTTSTAKGETVKSTRLHSVTVTASTATASTTSAATAATVTVTPSTATVTDSDSASSNTTPTVTVTASST